MDTEVVQEFAAHHEAALLRYAYLLTGSRSEAEDLVQNVFLRMLQGRAKKARELPAYAKRMIYNDFCSRLRRRHQPAAADDDVPTFEHDVVNRQWLWAELALLSPRQRAALVLRYYEGLPDNEITQILHCRPATVRSLVARALLVLKNRYEAERTAETASDREGTKP